MRQQVSGNNMGFGKLFLFIICLINCLELDSSSVSGENYVGGKFIHPGISFTIEDLELMKNKVDNNEDPWHSVFSLEEKSYSTKEIDYKTFVHIVSGPYSNPDIGGKEFERAGRTLYDLSILSYISGNDVYAKEAIKLLENWMKVGVWSFDENNTKLLVAESCFFFCNAAEILRYTYSGWGKGHTEAFSRFIMSSFYPIIRYYFPKANGNWDGANIRALLSIAVFTDNEQLFDNAINHYKYSHANGSLVKYIYPDGQCQESTRDQGHVQMGLGLFADAARIAYSQGVDLFSVADNRLALGLEYTSRYLLGEESHCYGIISHKKRDDIRSNYLHAVKFYNALGYRLPYSEKIVNKKIEEKSNAMDILAAFRAKKNSISITERKDLNISDMAFQVGAKHSVNRYNKNNVIEVSPGQSIQSAIDRASKENKIVLLMPGQHLLIETLLIPSNTHIVGFGRQTILMSGKLKGSTAIAASKDMGIENIILENFILEASYTYGSEPENTERFERKGKFSNSLTGINFSAHGFNGYKNITLKNLTVNNYSRNGVVLSGVRGLLVINCDFSENGTHVVPGPRLQHNFKLTHVNQVEITNSRFDTSLKGAGIYLEHGNSILIDSCEIARNGWFGVAVTESDDVKIKNNLIEGNDASAVYLAFQYEGSTDIRIENNILRLNNGYGVESFKTSHLNIKNNDYDDNYSGKVYLSDTPTLLLEDLRTDNKIDD